VRKLIPPILFLICLALMGLLRWLWPVRVIFPFPFNLLGIVPILAGLLIGFWGVWQFRKSKANVRPFTQPDVFVVEGPYRFTRNPMYLGVVLMLVGAWVLMEAVTPVVGVLIFFVTADRGYIPVEEEMLRGEFGQSFDAYCSKVRRWI
jgi:protein-S-isoprenylcysteine O-methyltransferase Ste14